MTENHPRKSGDFRRASFLVMVLLAEFLVVSIPPSLGVAEYEEEQEWGILIDTSDIGRSLARARVTVVETIHPYKGSWKQIGPFRFFGNLTNIKAQEIPTNRTLGTVVSRTGLTTDIVVRFQKPEKDGYKVALSYDWLFQVNRSDSILTVDQLYRVVFNWGFLTAAQLQTTGHFFSEVPQRFTVTFSDELAVSNVTHGVIPLEHALTQGVNTTTVQFSVVLPKGFMSTEGFPVPQIYSWKLVLGPRFARVWAITPKPGQNVSGTTQILALVSSATPVRAGMFRVDQGSWHLLNVSGYTMNGFWNSTEVQNGNHTITILVSNNAGLNSTVAIPIVVSNPSQTRQLMFHAEYIVAGITVAVIFLVASTAFSRHRRRKAASKLAAG